MPEFTYRGRDQEGRLHTGKRSALTAGSLSANLLKEGISPIQIIPVAKRSALWTTIRGIFRSKRILWEELAIFSRQMQLLHRAGVPIVIALKQLAAYTRSQQLAEALYGIIEELEKGQNLGTAMQNYPAVFSKLIVNIIQIGENTGHLSEAFGHLHQYLEFELNTAKQFKAAFRYPAFVSIAILIAIVILNIFVIPSFARFYANVDITLPWQTRLLISISNFFIHYGIYLFFVLLIVCIAIGRYVMTAQGKLRWHKFKLRVPLFGKLIKRMILIRFSQSFAIILNSGISVTQGLTLINHLLQNTYINDQIKQMRESIERGSTFTQAIGKVELFTQLELQILGVGEKNGEFGPALDYIAHFHSQEIQFDVKRMNDMIGPLLISSVSILILIIALGVYLPIWNMIDAVH